MSCPYHGIFQRNCSWICQNHHHRITEQEAEQQMMMTALTMSNSVLDEPEETPVNHREQTPVNHREQTLVNHREQTLVNHREQTLVNHREQTNRQEELDMELVLAISHFDRWENPHFDRWENLSRRSPQPYPRLRRSQPESHSAVLSIQGTGYALSSDPAGCPSIVLSAPSSVALTVNSADVPLGMIVRFIILPDPAISMPSPPEEVPPEPQDEDSPYYGLHPMYHDYRFVPIKFSEEHQWPTAAVNMQLVELRIDRGNEDIVEWQQGQSENDRCLICLTNVATRIAVPCGHKQSCRECISRVITTTKSNKRFLAQLPNGELRPTRYQIPVRCLICRCIIGMIVVNH